MQITVTTVPGKPILQVPDDTTSPLVRALVAHSFGYQQIGVPHCWSGNLLQADAPSYQSSLTNIQANP